MNSDKPDDFSAPRQASSVRGLIDLQRDEAARLEDIVTERERDVEGMAKWTKLARGLIDLGREQRDENPNEKDGCSR